MFTICDECRLCASSVRFIIVFLLLLLCLNEHNVDLIIVNDGMRERMAKVIIYVIRNKMNCALKWLPNI